MTFEEDDFCCGADVCESGEVVAENGDIWDEGVHNSRPCLEDSEKVSGWGVGRVGK